jgi:hypothetical protein
MGVNEFLDDLEARGVRCITWTSTIGQQGAGITPQGGGWQSYGSSIAGNQYMGGTVNPNAWSQPQAQAQSSYSSGGGGGGAPNPQITALLNQQQQQNQWAKDQNIANWNMGRDAMMKVGNDYAADPIAAQTRGQVMALLQNPEAINNRTQGYIQNMAANQIANQQQGQLRNMVGSMANSGNLDSASMLALQERMGRQGMAQQQATQTGLEVQRANQRNTDIQNAIRAGQSMSQQDFSNKFGVANSILDHLPQYRPDDLSGWIAAMGGQGGGGGASLAGSGGVGMASQGNGMTPQLNFGYNGAKYGSNNPQAGFYLNGGNGGANYNTNNNFGLWNLGQQQPQQYNQNAVGTFTGGWY